MLQTLTIRNLALLEALELEFEAGFTAVTGETGAGKSILLGGLALLAGERADKSIVRQGAPACDVSAAIAFAEPDSINALLEELGLPACEEGMLVVRRTVPVDKPQKAWVNGSPATLAALQRLGERWIDFHGPSEPRRLLKEGCQLELLDLFARDREALEAYRREYRDWRDALAEQRRLAEETALSPDQLEYLRQQLRQFEAVDLADDAIEALERDHLRMSRAQELIALAGSVAGSLGGEDGAQGRLALALREARRLAEIDPASAALAERLAAAAVELNDLAAEFTALGQDLANEGEAAEALAARMNAWLEIKRRHGPDAGRARAARDALERRLEVQKDFAGAFAAAERRALDAEQRARAAAARLRGKREKAAQALARAAAEEIGQLGFARAAFEVRVRPATELGPDGDCTCEFLFSPNVGEEPRALARIASSGELARVMLALKAVLAELDGVPVLVFDEVDANVGGEIGRVVGQKMAAIGRSRQVLCVTHLPQVAAQAESHLVVEKDQSKARAVVSIRPIHGQPKARVSELARMLGDRAAKSALAHAAELLGK
ncbi:MAG TPA: AAA family ATPase [Opitutaceae bacterium]|nr:AAA family ATPase [Opitutaceae bacterium]